MKHCAWVITVFLSQVVNGFEFKNECGDINQAATYVSNSLLLSGGADSKSKDEKAATRWLINQADKGDYLVIRTGGVGGQAKWICKNFLDDINSASEISIDSVEDANHPAVIKLINSVEIIWIAGGDQNKYENYWKGSTLVKALNEHIKTKAISGSSAGMAILGGSYYAPEGKAVIGSQILNNPYHEYTQDIFHGDLLQHPFMQYTINETHLNRKIEGETRHSRMLGLLARTQVQYPNQTVRAIGLNEGSFLAINKKGIGKVFGDQVILLSTNKIPEKIEKQKPLIWDHQGQAVMSYIIKGSNDGNGEVDILKWSVSGGTSGYWSTKDGYDKFMYQK